MTTNYAVQSVYGIYMNREERGKKGDYLLLRIAVVTTAITFPFSLMQIVDAQ